MSGRRNVEPKESGEASTGPNQSNIPDHNRWVKSIEGAGNPSGSQKARIHRVPAMLQENEEFLKYYQPKVVSIGPYHHSNPELRKEEIKLKMAKDFAQSSGVTPSIEATIEGWYTKIEGQWRDCYKENTTDEYDNPTLARMMLLDGCFILQYIDKMMSSDREKYFQDLKMKSHEVAFVQQDLFLLDNQLPYGLLKTLMDTKERDLKGKIHEFISRNIIKSEGIDRSKNPTTGLNSDPSHLLELLRELLLGSSLPIPANKCCPPWPGRKNTDDWHSFRNVKELIAVGIKLKPSDTYCLRNVSYTPFLMKAYLKLPQINVDDATASKFLNLIAYEMCPGGPDDFAVTSYVCLLDSLIDHPDDVKQLRDARILHNFLGSDQEVAELFNKIGTDLVPNNEAYGDVKRQIQGHYDSKVRSWVALFIHDHFSTPWTVLAFMAAMVGLAISSIQSYYALFPRTGACESFCRRF